MIFGTQESCSNLFDEIIQPEDTQFLGPRKGEVHLGPPVGFQDSKKFQPSFFWNIGISDSVGFQDSKLLFFLNHVSTHTIHHVKKI